MCGRVSTRGKVYTPGSKVPVQYNGIDKEVTWGAYGPSGLVFNARSESVDQRPMFKEDWIKNHKMVLSVDQFYEHGCVVSSKDGQTVKLLCLYLEKFKAFVVVTQDARAGIEPYHHRMPVVLLPRLEDLKVMRAG